METLARTLDELWSAQRIENMRQLVEHRVKKDDLAQKRLVTHVATFAESRCCQFFQASVRRDGYRASVSLHEGRWRVGFTRVDDLLSPNISNVTNELIARCYVFNGNYEGWTAPTVAPPA